MSIAKDWRSEVDRLGYLAGHGMQWSVAVCISSVQQKSKFE